MQIGVTSSPSLDVRPRLPVWIRWIDGEPRILADGVPVVPFNTALRHRARHEGATRKSLAAYARAGALYATYCAHQRVGLLDVSNDEFPTFVDGLLGLKFRDANGNLVDLDGHVRSRASADHYLTLLYSLAGDVAHLYDVSFDWRRHRKIVGSSDGLTAVMRANLMTGLGQRVHRVRHTSRKVVGLPDEEFEKMLLRSIELWSDYVAPGDREFALEPERRRGALLHRNVGILLCMRYAGARRSEVTPIRIDQVDRQGHHLDLQTKGHRKGDVECLPVVLYPEVAAQLWKYFTEYRPVVSNSADQGYLFLSHGVRDYGRPISDSVIRDIFDQLRPALSPRWSKQGTPHSLRHACAYQLQGRVSPDVIMAQMRHRSTRSLDPYRASALAFADQLLPTFSGSVKELMIRVGLGA
jgi:integrase